MTIIIDDGEKPSVHWVKPRVAEAIKTLLESGKELKWSKTNKGYGVVMVDKKESEE